MNYVISVHVVFRSGVRFSRRSELALVFLVSCAGLLINQAILYVCISRLSVGFLPAKLVATGGVFAWNYLLRSRFVFAGPSKAMQ